MHFGFRKRQEKIRSEFGGKIRLEKEKYCYRLTGSCDSWEEKVRAGLMAAAPASKIHLVNDISVKSDSFDENAPDFRLGKLPPFTDSSLEGMTPDVLIIGGGVIGASIARELSRYKLDILLCEKEYDVALHASSRNDGMVHPGIDLKPGLLKKKLSNRGNAMFDKLCEELNLHFERCGQFLCVSNKLLSPVALATLPYFNLSVAGKARYIPGKKLHRLEPGLSDKAKFALFFDGAGIVCPFNLTIALAENAIQNGVNISLNTAVIDMEHEPSPDSGKNRIKSVLTNRGRIFPKIVINAAGVFAEEIAGMAGDRFYSIHPRKGSSLILDKKAKKYIHTLYSLIGQNSKSGHTKGGGIVSTVHGNVLVGPSADEIPDKEDFTTDGKTLGEILLKHSEEGEWLKRNQVIAYFSGVRAATYEEDFILERGRATENIIHAAGMQSPGLTAAPAVGEETAKIAAQLLSETLTVEKNPGFNPRREDFIRCAGMTDPERESLIEKDPSFGRIVCRCEEISEGEIIAAMRRPLPCRTLDGIKRRVRPTAGRCQGGFCSPLLIDIIAKEAGIPPEEVKKGYPLSDIFVGERSAVSLDGSAENGSGSTAGALELKDRVCIICPNGCTLHGEKLEDGSIEVSGNRCPRGAEFFRQELTSPTRSITTTVATSRKDMPRLPVKTSGEVPKSRIADIIKEVSQITIDREINCGDTIISNVCGTGCNIVATKDLWL